MNFDHKLHQKVTYIGSDDKFSSPIYAIVKDAYQNLYTMTDEETIVIHVVNKYNQLIYNSHEHMQNMFKVKRKDVKFEGDLFMPLDYETK